MSYDTRDQAKEGERPVLLYEFVQGSTTYRYVAQPVAVTLLGQTWQPSALLPDRFARTNDFQKDDLTLHVSIAEAFAQTFINPPAGLVTLVTVYRGFIGETEYRFLWKGRVRDTALSLTKVTLTCEPNYSRLKRLGIRQVMSRLCTRQHYRRGCNLNPENFALNGAHVAALSGHTVTIPACAPPITIGDYVFGVGTRPFQGGYLKLSNGETIAIVYQNGSALTLFRPSPTLVAALAAHPTTLTVSAYIGCDRSLAACRSIFKNVGNSNAFVCLPRKNPFQVSLLG